MAFSSLATETTPADVLPELQKCITFLSKAEVREFDSHTIVFHGVAEAEAQHPSTVLLKKDRATVGRLVVVYQGMGKYLRTRSSRVPKSSACMSTLLHWIESHAVAGRRTHQTDCLHSPGSSVTGVRLLIAPSIAVRPQSHFNADNANLRYRYWKRSGCE